MSADLTPGSPEWCRRVSPSKAAAILGQSPWDSQRSIFHKMRGEAPWDEESEAMERGTLCEPAVLAWWRKHHEHTAWREQVSLTIGDWLVATPDAICEEPGGVPVVVQAKTTGSQMDEWGTPGTDEVPTHILIQVYLEMEVAHRNGIPVARAHIPVLGGYRNLFTNYVVDYDPEHGAQLMARMEAWRDLLATDDPPPLDGSVSTWDAIRRLHPEIDPKSEIDLDPDVAHELVHAAADLDAAKARDRLARAAALEAMGRHQYAYTGAVKVARRQRHGDDTRFVVVAKPTDLTSPQGDAA